MGFHQVRVRIHGMMARIEIEPAEFDKLMKEENRFKIVQEFKKVWFYICYTGPFGIQMWKYE